jgi:DNA replication protein DnaC
MNSSLEKVCHALRLTHVPHLSKEVQRSDPFAYLLEVLEGELREREANKWQRLLKKANFSQLKTWDDYDFREVNFPTSCNEEQLRSLQFVERRENLLMLGKVGTGKTHLSISLGVEACRKGYEVRFFRVADLVSILQEKHRAGTLFRFQKGLSQCDLLILDEVGFVPFHQTGTQLLFQVVSTLIESRSVIVTSNLEFGQWNTVFGDTRLTAALVDRLVDHAHIFAFTGESYRLRHVLSKQIETTQESS